MLCCDKWGQFPVYTTVRAHYRRRGIHCEAGYEYASRGKYPGAANMAVVLKMVAFHSTVVFEIYLYFCFAWVSFVHRNSLCAVLSGENSLATPNIDWWISTSTCQADIYMLNNYHVNDEVLTNLGSSCASIEATLVDLGKIGQHQTNSNTQQNVITNRISWFVSVTYIYMFIYIYCFCTTMNLTKSNFVTRCIWPGAHNTNHVLVACTSKKQIHKYIITQEWLK